MCGRHVDNLERHHMIFGTGYRMLSERYKLIKNICRECHHKIHHDGVWARKSKEEGQRMFETRFAREEFIRVFGRSWL